MNRAKELAIDIVIEAVNDGLTVAELEALPKELKKAVKWMKKHAFMSTRQEAKNTHPQTSPQTGIYGVSWNYEDPSNKPVRIGDAADFPDPEPASDLKSFGRSPFDEIMPWAGMRQETIRGNVMVYIPQLYFRARKNENRKEWTWEIASEKLPGFEKHPGSGKYVGRYHSSLNGEEIESASGKTPEVGISWTRAKELSEKAGEGWGMMDIEVWSAIQLLYLIEFASFDSKEKLEMGYTDTRHWRPGKTGTTSTAAYHTVKASGASNMYRWIEDPFANVLDWLDGFEAKDRKVFINGTETKVSLPEYGWTSGFGFDSQHSWAFLPDDAIDEDEQRGIREYVYSYTGGRVAYVGGYYYDNDYYGLFYLNAGNDASSAYASIGSRLLYNP